MRQKLNSIKIKEKHHFHLVDNSSLPLLISASTFLLVCSFVFQVLASIVWGYIKINFILKIIKDLFLIKKST